MIKESNPGQAYTILKKLGARPGDCEESNLFSLPCHEGLSSHEVADRIAEHFSQISREFPPLDSETLPDRVKQKLANPEEKSKIPLIYEHETYENILAANKPKSGVKGDLPRKLIKEFGPELALPVSKIFNRIIKSAKQGPAKWPSSWRLEYGTPLQKIPNPLTEDDLRIISLTPFFSKVLERFVVKWLMVYIKDKIDPKQFGGLKGSSISHYMIELLNFILYNQDYDLPIAVLASTVDFSKAFNRQNHNLLISKLSDMGVPGWLLNLVMGFLTDREMVVNYDGVSSEKKQLPGGGPQGTLLGLLLFLILINLCGFDDQNVNIGEMITQPKNKFTPQKFHTKYVDDMMIAESFNIKEALVDNPNRPLPDNFHARLGQTLPAEKSVVYNQILKIKEYADENQMMINFPKTKFLLFNPTKIYDFIPELTMDGHEIETVEEMKLLGLIITNDLSWTRNTEEMTRKGYSRLWMVKRLLGLGGSQETLIDVYCKQIGSVLEFGVPVWNSSLTQEQVREIERVKKSFLHVVLGEEYEDYENALALTDLESLEERRLNLCTKFAIKAFKHPNHSNWFVEHEQHGAITRSEKSTFDSPLCRLKRFKKSPIPYLTGLLNTM